MLLESYQLDVINNHCMPGAQSVNCIARLDQNVGCAIPYLNAVLEGDQFTPDPPSITLRNEGKLIAVTERTITVNAVQDEAQGRKIVEWIRREINEAWEGRENIAPRNTRSERPQLLEILKRLPRTNCKKCGAPRTSAINALGAVIQEWSCDGAVLNHIDASVDDAVCLARDRSPVLGFQGDSAFGKY